MLKLGRTVIICSVVLVCAVAAIVVKPPATPAPPSFGGAMKNFDSGITSIISSFQSIANFFGSKTTNKIIKEQICLGFNRYTSDSQVNIIDCMPPADAKLYIGDLFSEMAWVFNASTPAARQNMLAAQILASTYDKSDNWTGHRMVFTNNGSSRAMIAHAYVNHVSSTCVNLVTYYLQADFVIAPDVMFWQKSKTTWGGAESHMTDYIKKIPHKITLDDVMVLTLFFEVQATGDIAGLQNITYSWPKLSHCGGSSAPQTLLRLTPQTVTWNWLSGTWSNCSKACDGGTRTRIVQCVSSSGHVDPTGNNCTSPEPASVQVCNPQPCHSGKLFVANLVRVTNIVLRILPASVPKGISSLMTGMSAVSAYDETIVPTSELETLVHSWATVNAWPNDIEHQVYAMALGAQAEAFSNVNITASVNGGSGVFVVLGSATLVANDTVQIGYVSVQSDGTLVTQHYGNERTMSCPLSFSSCTSQVTYNPGVGCGCGIDCGDYCCAVAFTPGVAVGCATAYADKSSPVSVEYTSRFVGEPHSAISSYGVEPQYCGCTSFNDPCNGCFVNGGLTSTRHFDITSCVHNHIEQNYCVKPLSPPQLAEVTDALQATARTKIAASVNLLAIKMHQPPPYTFTPAPAQN